MRILVLVLVAAATLFGCAPVREDQVLNIPIDRSAFPRIKPREAVDYLIKAAQTYHQAFTTPDGRVVPTCEFYGDGIRVPGGPILPFDSVWIARPIFGANAASEKAVARIILRGYRSGEPSGDPDYYCNAYVRETDEITDEIRQQMTDILTALVFLGVLPQ